MSRGAGLLFAIPLLILGVTVSPVPVEAQPSLDGEQEYVYRYAPPGEATHTVYVWGGVDKPGIWRIEPDTDLVELFSVIYPSGYGQESPEARTNVRMRIHRSTNGDPRVVAEMNLDALLGMTPQERPSLQDGDVIEVRTVEKRKFSLNTVGTVVGTLSSVTLLIIRLFDF
jgi:hypothetical protein